MFSICHFAKLATKQQTSKDADDELPINAQLWISQPFQVQVTSWLAKKVNPSPPYPSIEN